MDRAPKAETPRYWLQRGLTYDACFAGAVDIFAKCETVKRSRPLHGGARSSDANFELMIGKRSDQDSNRVNNAGPPEEGSTFEIAAKEVARETKCDGSGSSGRRCGSNE